MLTLVIQFKDGNKLERNIDPSGKIKLIVELF